MTVRFGRPSSVLRFVCSHMILPTKQPTTDKPDQGQERMSRDDTPPDAAGSSFPRNHQVWANWGIERGR